MRTAELPKRMFFIARVAVYGAANGRGACPHLFDRFFAVAVDRQDQPGQTIAAAQRRAWLAMAMRPGVIAGDPSQSLRYAGQDVTEQLKAVHTVLSADEAFSGRPIDLVDADAELPPPADEDHDDEAAMAAIEFDEMYADRTLAELVARHGA